MLSLLKQGATWVGTDHSIVQHINGTQDITISVPPITLQDQVISINNATPDRIHLNWQAMAGINASFHLSGFIIFELEPEIRYYFNSVYEKSSTSDKPWSAGIRG